MFIFILEVIADQLPLIKFTKITIALEHTQSHITISHLNICDSKKPKLEQVSKNQLQVEKLR